MGLLSYLRGIIKSEPAEPQVSAEELRDDFRARYHHFKLLLTANNNALDVMAEIESMLSGTRPFGMRFVRSRVTRVAAQVYRMIQNMTCLAPGKYDALYASYQRIHAAVTQILDHRPAVSQGELVLFLSDAGRDHADLIGAKMASLAEAGRSLGLPIPHGFAITAAAYAEFMAENDLQAEIDRRIQKADASRLDEIFALSAEIQQLITHAHLPAKVERAILDAFAELKRRHGPGHVAMRSSALGEDALGASFAGQYRSLLNVGEANILSAYKEVVAGKYTPQAMAYRLNKGIPDEDVAMCVGCMRMIDAVSGGVAYSRNPLDLTDDAVHVNSVWGLPRAVVDGVAAADTLVLARDPLRVRSRDIPRKARKYLCLPEEGLCREELTDGEAETQSIPDDKLLELGAMAIRLEEFFGGPQDLEWALERDGRLVLLQSRPLRQAEAAPAPDVSEDEDQGHEVLLAGGVAASPGGGIGPVFVARGGADAMRFPDGAVLVVAQALPRWAALLPRAKALVAESGSLAGHLANVAREFGVPALLNLPDATKVLQDGVTVTVDASARKVYAGVREQSAGRAEPAKAFMEGTPVYDILREAAELIVPLSLLDPDAPSFRPENCRSMHDITRFCHEKAVVEMFRFGTEHKFPERAAKQLFVGVPMQFWVINLDDGFAHDVPGKYIKLSEIVSVPMLALWKGMVAKEWAGPPPINARGFMSVLLEASANPNLDPASESAYAARNYFMVSKNFANLQSRFGFHFCTVEALAGERAQENYASFSFKGGAANFERKVQRVRFIASFLEEYGFRCDVREDACFARVEGLPLCDMEERLIVLGYVIMHTRQLDMVMSDGRSAAQFAAKFRQDMGQILSESCQRAG